MFYFSYIWRCQINIYSKFSVYTTIDIIKWIVVTILLVLTVFGNYIYYDYDIWYRILIDVFVFIIVGFLVLSTKYGQLAVVFIRESYLEVRQVIWPTFRESLYTTVIVIVVTMIMSLILWSLDGILVRIVSSALRL